jgi:hypothetical protein
MIATGDRPHVLEEDMAATIIAGQRLVRWDDERVALKADDVLVVRASRNLLGLQLMLVGLAAAIQFNRHRHGVAVAALVVRARAPDHHSRERQDGDHRPKPWKLLATHHCGRIEWSRGSPRMAKGEGKQIVRTSITQRAVYVYCRLRCRGT